MTVTPPGGGERTIPEPETAMAVVSEGASTSGGEKVISGGAGDIPFQSAAISRPPPPPPPLRKHTIVYPSADAPACRTCKATDSISFNADCEECMELLRSERTTVPEIFAILRQWTPQTQSKIHLLVTEILRRGAHVNDRDGLTDMTLLHYACKSGAIGDASAATQTIGMLLDKGADLKIRCRWTDMAPIHYATYFDVPSALELLLKASKKSDIEATCSDFSGGTPLHISAINLCAETAQLLLDYGANVNALDNAGRTPAEVIPQSCDHQVVPEDAIETLRQLLTRTEGGSQRVPREVSSSISGRVILNSLKLQIGDQVSVRPNKIGILRYCGTIHFAAGVWAGIELNEPYGKNDGSLGGVMYFKCAPNHGLFAPITKIQKYPPPESTSSSTTTTTGSSSARTSGSSRLPSYGKLDVSHVTPKVETGLRGRSNSADLSNQNLSVGDRVAVGRKRGTLRFLGETKFAAGLWCGVELDRAVGKNDGSVSGVQYFSCERQHGIFALAARVRKLTPDEDGMSDEGESNPEVPSGLSSTDADSLGSPASVTSNNSSSSRKSSFGVLLPSQRAVLPARNGGGNNVVSTTLKKGCWLQEGMNVMVAKELGVLRYIGPVHFDEGTWLGVELRNPLGKNDGSINGHRYFSCKPGYGVICRPSRVTVRGINGAKLFDQKGPAES